MWENRPRARVPPNDTKTGRQASVQGDIQGKWFNSWMLPSSERLGNRQYQLSQMDPRDALPREHRAVDRGGRSV